MGHRGRNRRRLVGLRDRAGPNRAVECTVPFQFACRAIATTWHAPGDVGHHRARAPGYTTKSQPSTADMLAKPCRVLIVSRSRASGPGQAIPEVIHVIRLAWEKARHDYESRV